MPELASQVPGPARTTLSHLLSSTTPGHVLAASTAGPSPLWYATRATGVVALILLTITVALGISGVSRLSSPRWPRVITAGLHKNLSLLVVAFVVVHVLTTVLDSFVSIGLISAVIPFTSSYRTTWVSLGAVAFDLILALIITSLLRTRMSYRSWRAVHLLAYASWPIALWHGLGTGTDSKVPWLLAIDALCLLVVAGALLWRLHLMAPGPGRMAAMAAAVAVPAATVIFAILGPLHPHWSERAGTPVALLGSAHLPVDCGRTSHGRHPFWLAAYSGGDSVRPTGGGQEIISVHGQTSGQDATDVTIALRGTPDGSGISMSGGTVRLAPAAGGSAWAGPVTALDGTRLAATLTGPGHRTEQTQLTLVISGSHASGRVLTPAAGAR